MSGDLTYASLSLDAMQALAKRLAATLRPGDALALAGDLGAGKTSFVRALIQAITVQPVEVTSPTFTLMQSYDVKLAGGKTETLWHLDLYRLEHRDEAQALGLPELWPHIVVIEWPEIIESLLPANRLNIAFDFGDTIDTRTLGFSGNDAWRSRMEALG